LRGNPLILDDVHYRLRDDLGQLFYLLHFRPGIECSGANEPDLLCGSCAEGSPIIRQMNKLPAFHQSKGYTRAPITQEWMKEAFALRSGSKLIGSATGEFRRAILGLNVLFSGLRETGQERLYQLVRSLEALILPDTGKTKKQFIHRCQTFVTPGASAQLALQEIFDMRSDTEHLQDRSPPCRSSARQPPDNEQLLLTSLLSGSDPSAGWVGHCISIAWLIHL
jgi:hypothetical protein